MKHTNFLFNAFLFVTLVFPVLYSCSDNANNPNENTSKLDLLPLAYDNQWVYEKTVYDTLTHEVTSQYLDTIRVISSIKIGFDSLHNAISAKVNKFPGIDEKFYYVDIYKTDSSIYVSSQYSDSYNVRILVYGNSGDTITHGRNVEITDTDYKVKTGSDSYSCKVYRCNNYQGNVNIYYFSSGTGLIKFEQYYDNNGNMSLIKNLLLVKKDLK